MAQAAIKMEFGIWDQPGHLQCRVYIDEPIGSAVGNRDGTVVDLAVMSLVLPHREHAGRDLGILAVATGLPQIMSSVVAGGIINYAGGYITLYVFGGLCALVSGVVVFFIRKVR